MIDANKAGVRFNNKVLRKLNEDWMLAKSNYEEQQKAVVAEIINIACMYSDYVNYQSQISMNLIVFEDIALNFVVIKKSLLKSPTSGIFSW